MKTKFEHLVVGGTFDFFHKGHKSLIDLAISRSQKVSIGLTSDEMVLKSKGKKPYFSFAQREKQIRDYFTLLNFSNFEIVKIDDPYSVALTDETIDGIIVSKETVSGAEAINKQRLKLGLLKLSVIVAPIVLASDDLKISSSRIFSGEMDNDGFVYAKYLEGQNFQLPDNLRLSLGKPLGKIVKNNESLKRILGQSKNIVVYVGDEVTRTAKGIGNKVDLTIVDFKINRIKQIKEFSNLGLAKTIKVAYVKNSRGTINSALTASLLGYFKGKLDVGLIKVEGEEDLAVIPVILLSPIGTMVVYGQRNVGTVIVKVDEKLKTKILKMLEKFKTF